MVCFLVFIEGANIVIGGGPLQVEHISVFQESPPRCFKRVDDRIVNPGVASDSECHLHILTIDIYNPLRLSLNSTVVRVVEKGGSISIFVN
jgi:hypothetical protein